MIMGNRIKVTRRMIVLTIIFIDVASVCCEYSTKCGPSNACICMMLSRFRIQMDCHGTELNTTEICGICNLHDNITVLDISNINFGRTLHIPGKCFYGCRRLQNLSLCNSNINSLAEKSFAGLTELKRLDLSGNMLIENGKFKNPRIFKSVSNLEVLRLQGTTNISATHINVNYLSNIPNNSFPGLRQLYIDGTRSMLFGSNFLSFKKLRKIDFTGDQSACCITQLTNTTFKNIPQVRHLNLAFCNLSFIDAGAFAMLSNLTYLNLSNNQGLGFVSLRNVSFGLQSTQIQILDYSKIYKQFGLSTELRRCDVWYLQNTTIKELYLDNNRLALVEVNALHLFPPSLEVVSAIQNLFSYGPYAVQIGCLQNLRRVEINQQYFFANPHFYNKEAEIKEKKRKVNDECHIPKSKRKRHDCPYLDDGQFNLFSKFSWPKKLKTFNFRGSNLPIIGTHQYQYSTPPLFKLNISIESIDASYNIINSLQGPYVIIESLKHLNLSNNFASVIEDDFFSATPNLLSLDISNNFLGPVLSETNGCIFQPLNYLQVLDLSSNKITFLPDYLFTPLTSLSRINLAFNSISEIRETFASLPNLAVLELRQNKLSTLPVQLLHQLDETARKKSLNVSIDLSNNTLEISCENLHFLEWFVEHPKHFKNLEFYVYRYNGQNRVIPFSKLQKTIVSLKKNCKDYSAIIIISTTVILGFIVSILAGIIYRFRWRLRYLYYMTKSRYRGYHRIVDETLNYRYDAFISYAHEDYRFVKDEVIVELEDNYGLSLCVHQRDFLPGNYIAENILQAIKNSRMTVIILTNQFLKSKWCIYEFNMARMESIYSRNRENFVFCIMYEDIDTKHLSRELIQTLESETYQRYPQDENERTYFWQMVKKALANM